MKFNWIVWGALILAALWIFNVHFLRGYPVKKK